MPNKETNQQPDLASTLNNHFTTKYDIADGNSYSILKSTMEVYSEFQEIYFDDTLSIGDLAKWLNAQGYKVNEMGEWMFAEK